MHSNLKMFLIYSKPINVFNVFNPLNVFHVFKKPINDFNVFKPINVFMYSNLKMFFMNSNL